MSKHSEGPWKRNATLIFTESLPSRVVCELSEPEPGKWLEHKRIELGSQNWLEAMENGELIKAAPQMAAALIPFASIKMCGLGVKIEAGHEYHQSQCQGCREVLAARAALDAAGVEHA